MSFLNLELILDWVWRASWQASLLAALVLLLQWVLRDRLDARARYLLWMVVLVRLLLPVLPESPLSIFNLHRDSSSRMALEMPANIGAPRMASVFDESVAGGNAKPRAVGRGGSDVAASFSLTFRTVMHLAAVAYLIVVAALSARVAWACFGLSRLLGRLAAVDDPRVDAAMRSATEELGLRSRPCVFAGELVSTPALVGVWRPRLLLPTRVLQQCDSSQLRLVLMHELAHMKRRDVAVNWIITVATIIHWFNPIVWLVARRIRADRELACDEQVLASDHAMGGRNAYGQTLIRLIELLAPAPVNAIPQPVVGILEMSGAMQRRVHMIAKFNPARPGRSFRAVVILLALACTTLTDAVETQSARGSGAGGSAPTTRPIPAQIPIPDGTTNEVALRAALERVLPEVRFDAVPVGDVIDYLRDVSGANVVVNWHALEASGIDRKETRVSEQLRNITLANTLEHVLRDVGGGTVRLGYTLDNGAIVISSQEDLAGKLETTFYDVRDLIVSPDGQPLTGDQFDTKMNRLVEVIVRSVSPESWDANGGAGAIQAFNNKLIVRQTRQNQERIAELLAKLREKPASPPQAPTLR